MSSQVRFEVLDTERTSGARLARLTTPHGALETPAFTVVGTQGTVKSLLPSQLAALGAQAVLCNTYHLYLRPGADLVAAHGGLHRFMGWPGPIFTDSGGYQVFSLGAGKEHGIGKLVGMFPDEGPISRRPNGRSRPSARLTRVDEDGVTFRSHVDGSTHRLTAESSIQIQEKLGADVIVAFDEPTSPLHDESYTRQAMERTHRWATRCLDTRTRSDQALYGVVQGGAFEGPRTESARYIGSLPFDGFAIGGSLGKSKRDMHQVLDWSVPHLDPSRPRHMLGIGEPEDLFACVERGIDTFDCVAPTRLARHGVLYTRDGRLTISNASFRGDLAPIDADCRCPTCQQFTRAYLRHLFVADELLAFTLATMHNLYVILTLVARIRQAIASRRLDELKDEVLGHRRARA